MKLHNLILPYNTISIIGMDKNVGKTTVLNKILEEAPRTDVLGLSSIGRDGEDIDRVTSTHKPKIWISDNTIIATAKDALFNSDITYDILESTNYSTPMGDIIIAKALSSGYIDLAGPSTASKISSVRDKMMSYGANKIIIDGALSRKGCTYIDSESATILSTGASLGSNLNTVVGETLTRVKLLNLSPIDLDIRKRISCFPPENKIIFLGKEDRGVVLKSVLHINSRLLDYIDETTTHIFIRGAIMPSLIEKLIKNRKIYKSIEIISEDGTKFFIDENLHKKSSLCNIGFKVYEEINLVALTINPISPSGDNLDPKLFKRMLESKVDIPVLDVLGEDYEIS